MAKPQSHWASAPAPQLQALLNALAAGRSLHLCLPN